MNRPTREQYIDNDTLAIFPLQYIEDLESYCDKLEQSLKEKDELLKELTHAFASSI